VLFVASTFVIDLLLGSGAFDAEDVARTGGLLAAFALSVPIESLTYPLARAIYATRNTILPVTASIIGFIVTVVATLTLEGSLGLTAIAVGFTIGIATKLALLAISLPFRVRALSTLAHEELAPPDR
jgi:peptidoglycan biosynthesis protein MviN/MurJ (putative lipid II flippase)